MWCCQRCRQRQQIVSGVAKGVANGNKSCVLPLATPKPKGAQVVAVGNKKGSGDLGRPTRTQFDDLDLVSKLKGEGLDWIKIHRSIVERFLEPTEENVALPLPHFAESGTEKCGMTVALGRTTDNSGRYAKNSSTISPLI